MAADPEAPREGLLQVGRIRRSHGLGGEVVVELGTHRPERTGVGAIHITDDGDLVVAHARPHQEHWLVRYEGVQSRESADALRGTVLWGEPIDDEDTLWVHELVGCRVIDSDGTDRGTVVALVANPASDLLELDSGALVPTAFVLGPPEDGEVRVEVPDGLFDL